jgi:hypothetical protein
MNNKENISSLNDIAVSAKFSGNKVSYIYPALVVGLLIGDSSPLLY